MVIPSMFSLKLSGGQLGGTQQGHLYMRGLEASKVKVHKFCCKIISKFGARGEIVCNSEHGLVP